MGKTQDRVRVYYDEDDVIHGVEWFNSGVMLTDEDKLDHEKAYHLADMSVKIINSSLLPEGHDYAQQLYFDGDTIAIDTDKVKGVMPANYIKMKHMTALNAEIDELLDSESPDAIEVAKLQRCLEKCKPENNELFWYKQAEENLDKRVSNGKADKPVIRKKLAAKIKDLG